MMPWGGIQSSVCWEPRGFCPMLFIVPFSIIFISLLCFSCARVFYFNSWWGGKAGLFTFFSFWMCLVFKTHSVPIGNKISCSKMGQQLTACTKHCILNYIKKCTVNNETKPDRKTYSPMFLKTNTKNREKQQPDKKHRDYLWIAQCRLKKVE
jgi:hypothetical protein